MSLGNLKDRNEKIELAVAFSQLVSKVFLNPAANQMVYPFKIGGVNHFSSHFPIEDICDICHGKFLTTLS